MVEQWYGRINQLPDYVIESAINRIPPEVNPPTPAERKKLREFLVKRKGYLFDHIIRQRSHFGLPPRIG
jgi:hypothetical protein